MKLTRDQLRGPWTEGLIIGFINKRQAEEMLLKRPPGTFLLRFSDSELGKFEWSDSWQMICARFELNVSNPIVCLFFFIFFVKFNKGGITIAWVEHTVDAIPQIVMLQPFCHKDFGIRSLGDRIKDLNQCVYLYPDIPKDKAFGNYYTPLGGKIYQFKFHVDLCVKFVFLFRIKSWIVDKRICEANSKNNCARWMQNTNE